MRLFDIMEMLLAAAVGIYMFFRIRRLLRFYGIVGKKKGTAIVCLVAAACLGASCLDLWTTRAMVILHFAGLFLVTDLVALLVRRVHRWFSVHREGSGKARRQEGGRTSSRAAEQPVAKVHAARLHGAPHTPRHPPVTPRRAGNSA